MLQNSINYNINSINSLNTSIDIKNYINKNTL